MKKNENLKRENIHVSENHEFFIALCNTSDHYHLIAGVHDLKSKKKFILLSLGKEFDVERMGNFCPFLLPTPAQIVPQGFFYHRAKDQNACDGMQDHEITYKSISITRDQFDNLVCIMQQVHDPRSPAHVYFYEEKSITTPLEFKFKKITDIELKSTVKLTEQELSEYHSIWFGNSCKTTSSKIIDKIVGSHAGARVTYWNLPYKTGIKGYNLSSKRQFYILPQPPNPVMKDKELLNLLEVIYTRMENVIKINEASEITAQKFDALKELYNSILADGNKNTYRIISEWDKMYTHIIDTPRKYTCETDTRKMLQKIYKKIPDKKKTSVEIKTLEQKHNQIRGEITEITDTTPLIELTTIVSEENEDVKLDNQDKNPTQVTSRLLQAEVPPLTVRKVRDDFEYRKKFSSQGYQLYLLKLGRKIIDLDDRSYRCWNVSSTQQILIKKRDSLVELYQELKNVITSETALSTQPKLEKLSLAIKKCNDDTVMNTFCYAFGTAASSLFSSQRETDTLKLLHEFETYINSQLDIGRPIL